MARVIHSPTAARDDNEIDEFYEQVNTAVRYCKSHEVNVIMGDWNAKVGSGRDGDVVGPFGLGDRNDRGNQFVEWCSNRDQIILNTWFQHHPRRLWTWKSPGDRVRNQIDYITVNKRYRNAVTQCRTYPGADCGRNCDHVPVVAQIKVKLKKLKKKKTKPRREWRKLKK